MQHSANRRRHLRLPDDEARRFSKILPSIFLLPTCRDLLPQTAERFPRQCIPEVVSWVWQKEIHSPTAPLNFTGGVEKCEMKFELDFRPHSPLV